MSNKNPFDVTVSSAFDLRECDMQIRMLPMRDGKRLYTVVCLPPGADTPRGVIVARTPYFQRDHIPLPNELALKYGFAFVNQSCRGTAWSEGKFSPADRELEERDGEDLLAWILEQPWCNGKIAFWGSSYSGWTQWAAAYKGNPAVVSLRPHVAPIYGCCTMARLGGGDAHGFMIAWGLTMSYRNQYGYNNVPDFDKFLEHLPVSETDKISGCGYEEYFHTFIRSTQEPWTMLDGIREKFTAVTAPAFISGGWFDDFKDESFLSFKYIKTLAASSKARNFTRFIVGPWTHSGLINNEFFGEENDQQEMIKMQERFLVNLLNDPEKDPCPDLPVVQFFLMGENKWCAADDWPPPNREKRFYLHGGGILAEEPSQKEEDSSAYTYDPADATPSYNGGRISLGCYDRSDTEKRSDVLCFTTPVLQQALRIAGNVKVELFAQSDAPDTDFYATLTDVYPDGRSMYLASGMVRARFSKVPGRECFLESGELRQYTLDLSETAVSFAPGHAVRLALHSANFPYDSRNMNTMDPINEGVDMQQANQLIFHDKFRPSCLILPELTQDI